MKRPILGIFACSLLSLAAHAENFAPARNSAAPPVDGAFIQQALNDHPNSMVFLPSGDYQIHDTIRITGSNSGIYGSGHIIQVNPERTAVEIEQAVGARLRDITISRPQGATDTHLQAINVTQSSNVVLTNLRVIDNRTDNASVVMADCTNSVISYCLIKNYSRIAIDDRTKNNTDTHYGYAFNCINGAGLIVKRSKGIRIEGNTVIETVFVPTPELKAKYNLGTMVKKNDKKGDLVSQKTWDSGEVSNWHQGSAIQINAPEDNDYIQVLGNTVENAAQGFDIQSDHVIFANNIINNAFMGMKAMHGARNILIVDNQFSKNDIWSIGLMPGTSSHYAGQPTKANVKPEETNANIDGYDIVANNIISDFGYGHAAWIWGNGRSPFVFDKGQLFANPPLTAVIISGNLLYDSGRDQILVNGKPRVEQPHYHTAVMIGSDDPAPKGLHFSNNLFDPGTAGVSDSPLPQ